MTTEFTGLEDIASGIAEKLSAGVPEFRTVRYTTATNGAQVLQMLESLAALPAAVVAIGQTDYEHEALKRTVRPVVFILDTFRAGMQSEAAGLWTLLAQSEACFLPVISADGADYPEVEGIEFVPSGVTPVESPENVSALALTLEGVEILNYE